mmetsp:Transcript_78159/g.253669  ORF Transcript_78159/g.253669 Transcript_78159/m.253669 type:complete len:327 (-) Transcript_78159:1129-2109(-)
MRGGRGRCLHRVRCPTWRCAVRCRGAWFGARTRPPLAALRLHRSDLREFHAEALEFVRGEPSDAVQPIHVHPQPEEGVAQLGDGSLFDHRAAVRLGRCAVRQGQPAVHGAAAQNGEAGKALVAAGWPPRPDLARLPPARRGQARRRCRHRRRRWRWRRRQRRLRIRALVPECRRGCHHRHHHGHAELPFPVGASGAIDGGDPRPLRDVPDEPRGALRALRRGLRQRARGLLLGLHRVDGRRRAAGLPNLLHLRGGSTLGSLHSVAVHRGDHRPLRRQRGLPHRAVSGRLGQHAAVAHRAGHVRHGRSGGHALRILPHDSLLGGDHV